MVTKLLTLILILTAAAMAQPTAPSDTAQYIRFGGGAKTVGDCLVWDSYGRVVSATCGAGGGEVNAGANLGSGSVVYTGKSGLNLQFRSFTVGSNKLSVTQNTNDIAFDLIPANNLLSSFGGSLNLSQIAQGGATTGQLLQWNGTNWAPASTGGGGGPANTDALAEGSTNLYYTAARARAALSVSGILSYDNGTGVFSCSNCANITSTYSNPAWISALAWSKLTGVPSYQLTSEKAAANGYASLNSSTLVPVAQLGTGTANSTTFLRGDGSWTTPSGSVNVLLAGSSIGTRPGLNLISAGSIGIAASDDAGNNRVNVTVSSAAYSVTRTSGTVLTLPATTANQYTYCGASTTPGATLTLTSGTGLAYVSMMPDCTIRVTTALVAACSAGCTTEAGSGFNSQGYPLGSWNATANVWDGSATATLPQIGSGQPALAMGTNMSEVISGGVRTISAAGGSSSWITSLIDRQFGAGNVTVTTSQTAIFTTSVPAVPAGGCVDVQSTHLMGSATSTTGRISIGGQTQDFNAGGDASYWTYHFVICNNTGVQNAQTVLVEPMRYGGGSFFGLLPSGLRTATFTADLSTTWTFTISLAASSGTVTVTPDFYVMQKI